MFCFVGEAEGEGTMFIRNFYTIDQKKTKEFAKFVNENGKSELYWEDINRIASTSVNKKELDRLFAKSED